MAAWIEMQQVQIFVLESAEWRGEPLYLALLQLLQRQGAAGATAIRALAGFGAHHQLHRATLVDVGAELPIVVVWIDETARVERLLPQVEAMAGNTQIVRMPVLATQRPPLQIAGLTNELRVRDLMTREVVTVKPSATLDEVAELLLHSGVRAVPVVDPERLVGLITDGDLLRRGNLVLPLRMRDAFQPHELPPVTSARRASDVMTTHVVTVTEDLPIARATELMARHGCKRLPVIDQQHRLVGIISRTDVLQAMAHVAPHVIVRHAPGGSRTVEDVMQRDVRAVAPTAPLAEVVELLAEAKQRRVVVVDEHNRVIGMITDGDLLRRSSARETSGVIRRLLERLRGADVEVNRFLVFSERMAADVMTSPVVTIGAAAPPIDALRLMLLHHVKRLPVLDADGRLVGLIGRTGILLALQAPRDTD